MSSKTNQAQQFITLIALASHPAYEAIQLPDHAEINLVYCYSHEETAKAISNRLFNLIIIDLNLDGIRLFNIAKNHACINYDTPIVALSDPMDLDRRKTVIAAGFDDCLIKPLDENQLSDLINLWQENASLNSYFESIETLLSKTKNNSRLVKMLYDKLFVDLPIQIEVIETAFNKGDLNTALDAAHALNGAVKTCYLKGIAENANALETALVQKNVDFADGYFLMLKQGVNHFIEHRETLFEFLNDTK